MATSEEKTLTENGDTKKSTISNGIAATTTTDGSTTNGLTANGTRNIVYGTGTSSSPDCTFKFTTGGSYLVNTEEEAIKYYDNWANTYDEWTQYCGYRGPEYLADLVKQYCKPTDLFLIVGVGTGLEAKYLYDKGYGQLHGLDASIEMLNCAKAKGHLLEIFHEFLQPNGRSSIESHRYDAMLCVGCFIPASLDERHLDDLLRTVKPGGLSIIGTREIYLNDPGEKYNYPYSLETKLKNLEQAGTITLLERIRKEKYGDGSDGVFFVHRVNH